MSEKVASPAATIMSCWRRVDDAAPAPPMKAAAATTVATGSSAAARNTARYVGDDTAAMTTIYAPPIATSAAIRTDIGAWSRFARYTSATTTSVHAPCIHDTGVMVAYVRR